MSRRQLYGRALHLQGLPGPHMEYFFGGSTDSLHQIESGPSTLAKKDVIVDNDVLIVHSNSSE